MSGWRCCWTPAHAQSATEQVYVLTYDGNIDPNAERYFARGIRLAEEDGAPLVVIKLDTPGGLLSSTEKIVEHLLGADVPVAVYVHPPGAFAASAGTFVTAAANFAVMAEGTSIGAAAPVSADGEDLPDTLSERLSEKATNITVAMAEGIAEKRGRDKEALTKTITEAEAYTASAAVEANLVDFVAVNMEEPAGTAGRAGDGDGVGGGNDGDGRAGGEGGGDEPGGEVLRVCRGSERYRAFADLRGRWALFVGAAEPRADSAGGGRGPGHDYRARGPGRAAVQLGGHRSPGPGRNPDILRNPGTRLWGSWGWGE